MLSHTDLKKGVLFILNGQPFVVLDFSLNFQGRGSSTVQARIKNLITGNVLAKVFHTGDIFEEAEIEKIKLKFIYSTKDQYIFSDVKNPSQRTALSQEQVGSNGQFLKPSQEVDGVIFEENIIGVEAPVKAQLKVKEAAAYLRAGRAEAGTKEVVLESGAKIQAPSFIEEGDIIEVNTQTGEYTRRVE